MGLLLLMLVTALGIVWLRSLFAVVMFSGIFSLSAAALWVILDSVDVAFTEAAVGAGIGTVLGLASLALTRIDEEKRDRLIQFGPLLIAVVTGGALIYGTLDMPRFGDPNAPIHRHVAPDTSRIRSAKPAFPISSPRFWPVIAATTRWVKQP